MDNREKNDRPAIIGARDPFADLSPAKRALLQQRLKGKKTPDASHQWVIPRRTNRATAPLSFAQEQLWLLDQMLPDRRANNVPRCMRLRGELEPGALEEALQALVDRHEILRTVYSALDGVPVQEICEKRKISLDAVDVQGLPMNDRESEIQRVLFKEIRRPFDLSKDLMLRAVLLKISANDHILLLVTHHIASDGWSKGILYRELAYLYHAFGAGKPAALAELPIQYADFAAWHRDWLQGAILEEQLSYWKHQLAGAPALLELPTDHPRPPTQSFEGATACFDFPQSLLDGLRTLSQQEGATLFMTLLAAFNVFLCRYTRQEDVVVGTPVSGRNWVETEPLIGDFFNLLVLRTDLSGDPPFRELLRRVRKVALEGYEHSGLRFEKLVAALQKERSLSHAPLCQVFFAFESSEASTPDFAGLKTEVLDIDTGTTKQDLFLTMVEDGAGLRVGVEYATGLFEAPTIQRMVGHWQILLESIAAQADQRISALPLLSGAERAQLLSEWNRTPADYPRDMCIHELFEREVEHRPNALAVVFGGEQLTYRELNSRANALAHYLRERGVGPNVLVGVCVERSADMVMGLLGVLKAGAAYVPLDPSLPSQRLETIIEDAQVSMLLTQQHLIERILELSVETVCLDSGWGGVGATRVENPVSGVTPEDLAYVIFTSGSTGIPKGVQLPHRAVVNFLHSMCQEPGMTYNDVHLGVATMSFDASVLDFFMPLTAGACLVVVPREAVSDPLALAETLLKRDVTVMHATPATWRLLVDSGWRGSKRLKIFSGGDALQWELAQQLIARSESLWNVYGPTETAVYSTIHKVQLDDGTVLVGRPINNTQIYILDAFLQPVPLGVPGELYIGGAGLALGYLNRPELTAAKFVPNPFESSCGVRLYRTGDLARYKSDGRIECLGRIDYQVKIRGFRVELGEIEAVLAQHQAVREAVVMAREDMPGDKRLVAYVVPDQEPPPTAGHLRSFLLSKLPDYMVPSVFVLMDALPLSSNRKVDRNALPAPVEKDRGSGFIAPRTPVEESLARIWSQALNVRNVGTQDSFFELGGHSLLATQIAARIRGEFNVSMPMRILFEKPSLAEVAEEIERLLINQENPDDIANIMAELESESEN